MKLIIYVIMACAWLLVIACSAQLMGKAIGDSLNQSATLIKGQ